MPRDAVGIDTDSRETPTVPELQRVVTLLDGFVARPPVVVDHCSADMFRCNVNTQRRVVTVDGSTRVESLLFKEVPCFAPSPSG
jgi:hypothetical protein